MEPCLLFVSFCLPVSEWLCHWFVQCWRLKLCQCVLAYEEHMRKLATRGGTLLITVTEKDKGGCFFRVFARSKTDTVISDFWHSLMYQKKKKKNVFLSFLFWWFKRLASFCHQGFSTVITLLSDFLSNSAFLFSKTIYMTLFRFICFTPQCLF